MRPQGDTQHTCPKGHASDDRPGGFKLQGFEADVWKHFLTTGTENVKYLPFQS